MTDFKFEFGFYYIEYKKKIEKRLSLLKNQLINAIDIIVEYNKKKFAPYNKERFQDIYNDYLKTFQKK